MVDNVPFMPIREFESENLEKMLEMDVVHDEPGTLSLSKFQSNKNNGGFQGESYSDSVDLILEGMGLGKYIQNFKAHDIGVNVLLRMTTEDLNVIGITNPRDQSIFRKQLLEFNGGPSLSCKDFYRIEEDLIMARNICSHLEDINSHLNFIQFQLNKNDFEDYFVNPKNSILRVFGVVVNRAMTQAKRISEALYNGNLNADNLVGAYLSADGLQLPQFMAAKLQNPRKEFKVVGKKRRWVTIVKRTGTLLAVCISVGIFVHKKFINK